MKKAILLTILPCFFIGILAFEASSQEKPHYQVRYGESVSQNLDVYLPRSEGPFPFVLFFHGGGWWTGTSADAGSEDIHFFLEHDIAYVSVGYRKLPEAHRDGLFPPLLGPLTDAKHALQFLRLHAGRYRLDAERAVAYGSSAGGFIALWLGLHPDQSDADSADPLERQSTKVRAAGGIDAQTSIDPVLMRKWVGPQLRYGGHAFGLPEGDFEEFLERRDEFSTYISQMSPDRFIRPDAPPVYLFYGRFSPVEERDHMYFVHSPGFGKGFLEEALEHGLPCTLFLGASRPGMYFPFLSALAREALD